MDELEKKRLELIQQSGFPFQIGVRKEIERTASDHGWRIAAEEHHWTHPASGKTGFIDLIAEHYQYALSLIIECKRVRPKDKHSSEGPGWLFLTPRDDAGHEQRLTGFKTQKLRDEGIGKQNFDKSAWQDIVDFYPPTKEAAYCVFETQDEKSPMIERIADTLLPSVEAVAVEWFRHTYVGNNQLRIFVPVIVTNATLYTCSFDAADIRLSDGILPSVDFQPVPFVRYRKGLTQVASSETVNNFKDANRKQQRSILIVNAESMADTFKKISLSI